MLSLLERNLKSVQGRIQRACERVDRDPAGVTLVAVSKYVGVDLIRGLYDLGVRDFGESRPQSIWEKSPQMPADIRWHLIGHWQTNKVRRTIPMIQLAHSLDRRDLATVVSDEAVRVGRTIPVLVEVKLVDDDAKHGFAPSEAAEFFQQREQWPGLDVRGLMCMASLHDDPAACRPTFAHLRQLRDELIHAGVPTANVGWLSMGMSQDFEVAIEEGATHVRVGSSLFEGLIGDD